MVLNAKLKVVIEIGEKRCLNVRYEILSAFSSYRFFENLTLLLVIYLSKARGRSAILRAIYNLKTFITYVIG